MKKTNKWNDKQKEIKQDRIDAYKENPKLCEFCNGAIPFSKKRQRFCSQTCNGESRAERYKLEAENKRAKCLNASCDNHVKCSGRLFCCAECSNDYKFQKRVEEVKRKGVFPSRQGTAKKILLRMNGHQCSICKRQEWDGKEIPLVMDHIDGNHKNNRAENLRLVCGNCDMLLPTYKSKNRGNGREYDREYRRKRGSKPNAQGSSLENYQ